MAKYNPLNEYLRQQGGKFCYLSFRKIENIIASELPPSAYEYRTWWGNEEDDSRVQAKAWMEAGWKVNFVELDGEVVLFVKAE